MVASSPRTYSPGLFLKITLPYVVLALLLALAAIYVVARMQSSAVANAYTQQVAESRLRVFDSIVNAERQQLAHVRTIARLEGLSDAVRAGDRQKAASLAGPYMISQHIDRVVFVRSDATVLGAMQLTNNTDIRNETSPDAGKWGIVQSVLAGKKDNNGDKFVALIEDNGVPVVYTAAPLFVDNVQAGVLVVGSDARNLVAAWRTAHLVDVTLYNQQGRPVASSFGSDTPEQVDPSLVKTTAPLRKLQFGSRVYGEVVSPLILRGAATDQFVGVALSEAGQDDRIEQLEFLLLAIFGVGVIVAVLLGTLLSQRITKPIVALASAAEGVTRGNLNQEVTPSSNDEVGMLANSFNQMITGLRERERMYDILGRFVSPTIAKLVLNHPLDLSGESRTLTILFTDLRDFTSLAETEEPATVIGALNAYFQIVVDAAERFGGVVNKFGGDSTLVIFGLTDDHDDPNASATAAVRAALLIRSQLEELNHDRQNEQKPIIRAGIGINTGIVVAGLIGSTQRMEYTVIGDAVNLSARVQALTRVLDSDILLSFATYEALGEPDDLSFIDHGLHHLKGKKLGVQVYGVMCAEGVVDAAETATAE